MIEFLAKFNNEIKINPKESIYKQLNFYKNQLFKEYQLEFEQLGLTKAGLIETLSRGPKGTLVMSPPSPAINV